MPNSASSLESLSSPSPSPPPDTKPSSSKDKESLSDSELSELTEDEHDSESNKNKRPVSRKMTKSDKEDSPSDPPPSRHNTRRKRGGIVPAPMWDWAKPKKGGMQSAEDDDETEDSDSGLGPPTLIDEPYIIEEDGVIIAQGPGSGPFGRKERTVREPVVSTALDDLVDTAINSDSAPTTTNQTVDALSSLADSILAQEEEDKMNGITTMPPPEILAPIIASAATSSIMAVSTVTPPISRSTSPSVSPPRIAQKTIIEKNPTPTKPDFNGAVHPKEGGELRMEMPPPGIIAAQITESPAIADGGEQEQDMGLEVEIESDVQPAHRAEALDVLAAIELKFALLRERVYVEKMAALAWEESLVNDGIHPEMTHLHEELSKRKDIRLKLASCKRSYELMNAAKRRRADEDAVWSWWKLARDDLQTSMIAETNRKRRKLERERRAIDRLQPVRLIPEPSLDVPPALPSFKEIVKESAEGACPPTSWSDSVINAYPDLHSLSHDDVAFDLSLIFHDQRAQMDAQRYGKTETHSMIEDTHLSNAAINPAPSNGVRAHHLNPPLSGEGHMGPNPAMFDRRTVSPAPPSVPMPVHEQWTGPDVPGAHMGDEVSPWAGTKRHDSHQMDDEGKARAREREQRNWEHEGPEYRDMSHLHASQLPLRSRNQLPHHHAGLHPNPHHHHHHHHHIVHHHHSQQNTHTLQPSSGPPAPPNQIHSPHSGSNQPVELINLSSKHSSSSQWKHENRDRESLPADADSKLTTLPPMDDRDRPMAMPFVMASTHTMQSVTNANPGSASGSRSPRQNWHSREDDAPHRMAAPGPSSYLGSHEAYTPNPPHRYGGSHQGGRTTSRPNSNVLGLSPPRHRTLQSPSPSSSNNYTRSPPRYNATPGPGPTRAPSRSPVLNKGHHGGSPILRTTGSSTNLYSQGVNTGHRTTASTDGQNTSSQIDSRIDSPFVPLHAPSPPPGQQTSLPAPNRYGVSASHGSQDGLNTASPIPSRSLASLLAPAPDIR